MQISLKEIASKLSALKFCERNPIIEGLCPLDDPQNNYIAFATNLSEKKIIKSLEKTYPAALLISNKLEPSTTLINALPLLQVSDPFQAIIQLMPLFYPKLDCVPSGVSQLADVHPSAKIGKNVRIAAFCSIAADVVIEDDTILYPHVVLYPYVKVGKNCVIHSGATIRENCIIGDNCVVQNGAVIGAEGFGYIPNQQGHLNLVPQVGIAEFASQVDIGANACVDRATLGATRVGTGSKIDNLVQIGHNVQIGKHSAICGGTGISGSCKIGNHVVLGGHTGVADHLQIADGVRIGSSGKIERNITEKGDYAGHPLMKVGNWKRFSALSDKIPNLIKNLSKSDIK